VLELNSFAGLSHLVYGGFTFMLCVFLV